MIVILGPTASGKSALAEAVARQTNAEILSIDSMQVYRGMNIGTAKPTTVERAAIPYHLLDVADPNQSFTVARFVESADACIADAARRSVPLIATGGTPLYYKSLFEGLFEGPPADPSLRERLSREPIEDLHRRLATVDPQAATRIHANDTRRVVRALEVFELTGKPISSFQTDWQAPVPASSELVRPPMGSRRTEPPDQRASEIDDRRGMGRRDAQPARPFRRTFPTAGEATGYRELIEHIRGRMTLDDAIEQIKIATRQLARKQMKWFKRFPSVRWLPGDRAIEENVREVLGETPKPQ